MRHHERRHTHQHHHAPAPALDNAHGIPQRRQRRLSDVSGLLFASDFPKFSEEPKFGMKPPCTCSQLSARFWHEGRCAPALMISLRLH